MLDLGALKASIILNDKEAKGKLDSFAKETDQAAGKLGGLQEGLKSIGDKANEAGKKLSLGITAPIAALGGTAIKAGMDFESSMSKVQAISGSTAAEMKQLEAKAKEMGASTKFSASEAGDAMTYMAMAGWDAQKMMDGLPGILSLAAADGLDLATTTDIVTDAMTAFGLSADKAGDFADLLAATASSANTNVSMLGESFKYAAPVAGAFGYSAEDTALALGLMANAGIKASMAGTSMRQILTNLTGTLALNVGGMENWIIECENADGTMVPLREQFVNLREAFSEMTEAERAQNAEMIAGKVGMSGLLAIMQASEEDFNNLVNNIDNSAGSAQRMADIMQDNVQGQLVILGSALEGTAIAFYECIKEPLKEAIMWLSEFVSSLIPVIEENGMLIATFGGVAAAIGPVLIGVGKVISIITSLMNPVTLIIAGLAALGAALVKLYQENEEFAKAVDELWASIKEMFDVVLSKVKELFKAFTDWCKDIWDEYGEQITNITITLVNFLKEIFESGFNVLKNVIDFFTAFFKSDFEGMKEAVTNIVESLWQGVKDLFNAGLDFLFSLVPTMWNIGCDLFNSLWDGIKSIWAGISSWVSDKVSWLMDKLTFWDNSTSKMEASSSNIDGSHESGINYVPFDGYTAQLHKGERVLTAEQARNYSDISTSRMESLLEQLNYKLDRLPRNLAIENRF